MAKIQMLRVRAKVTVLAAIRSLKMNSIIISS
jgi:hypothetical protein